MRIKMKYEHNWNSPTPPPTITYDGCVAVLGRYGNGEEVYLEYEVKYEDSSLRGYFTVDGHNVTENVVGWKYL